MPIQTITIKEGSTLTYYAKKYNTTVDELMRLNSDTIKDKNKIYTGKPLRVPVDEFQGPKETQRGDTATGVINGGADPSASFEHVSSSVRSSRFRKMPRFEPKSRTRSRSSARPRSSSCLCPRGRPKRSRS
jgi:LysM repeat protein